MTIGGEGTEITSVERQDLAALVGARVKSVDGATIVHKQQLLRALRSLPVGASAELLVEGGGAAAAAAASPVRPPTPTAPKPLAPEAAEPPSLPRPLFLPAVVPAAGSPEQIDAPPTPSRAYSVRFPRPGPLGIYFLKGR